MGERETTHSSAAEIRRLQDRLRVLSESTRTFAESTTNYQRLLDSISRRLAEVLGDTCSVLLLSEDETSLVPVSIHAPTPELGEHIRRSLAGAPLLVENQPLARRVLDSGTTAIIPKVEPGLLGRGGGVDSVDYEKITDMHSLMVVALRLHGKSIGILTLSRFRKEAPPFDDQDRDLAQILADHASLAIGNARAFVEVQDARDAAEKVKSELRSARARFVHLENSGLLGILVGNIVNGRVVEVNQTIANMVGFTREEILAPTFEWWKLTPPEWKEVDVRAVHDLGTTGVSGLREKELLRKDGGRVSVIIGSAMIEEANQAISFMLDITAQKKAAAEFQRLRQERAVDAKFRALVEAAPDALVIVANGHIVIVNEQAEILFGYTRDEMVGLHIDRLVPQGVSIDRDSLRADLFPIAPGSSRTRRIELVGRRKDGSEFPAEIALGPIETEEGRLVSSAIRDVTERKRNDELRFRLAAIVESSHDAIIACTTEGDITSWNVGAERMFGYKPEEAIGQSITLLLPEERKDRRMMVLDRARSGKVEQFETLLATKDGGRVDVSVTTSPLRDVVGRLLGASNVARDVTEARRAGAAVLHAKELAEAANRELESFSYSVAHDLRAPLRGMNGFAQVLLNEYGEKLDAQGKDWLQEILVNARRMGELIDALLSLSRLTRSTLNREPVDLSATARNITTKLANAEPERSVEVVIAEQLTANIDATLALALLENLIENAWKFSGKLQNARIEIGVVEECGEPTFFVRDNGAGFDMTYAGKLFTPFQRLHGQTEFPGTGIGLANVQRIVHRHGGKIWAEGEIDHGATFYFTLPNRPTGVMP